MSDVFNSATGERPRATPQPRPGPTRAPDARGRAVLAVFDALDGANIRYCVSHGYETYPDDVPSDVDCIVDPAVPADRLVALVCQSAAACAFKLVRRNGLHLVMAGCDGQGSLSFLVFDFSTQSEVNGLPLYTGEEMLKCRRRRNGFWAPRLEREFAAYLARSIVKRTLDGERGRRLTALFRRAPEACARQLGRFWTDRHAQALLSAAESGDWSDIGRQCASFASALRRRRLVQAPLLSARMQMEIFAARLERVLHPPGVYLALLGTDGAGKSSIIDALGPTLKELFPRSVSYGFVPEFMQRALHGANRKTDDPHSWKPRSMPVSVARALLYWLPYYTLGYAPRHLKLIRSTLVLSDRHLIDALVDSRRYRYGGPKRLLEWLWAASVKPDLVVLLDAPADVLYRRKQEMAFDEVARQRAAYVKLVRSLPNGHVVDATRELSEVADCVGQIIVDHVPQRRT